MSRQSELVAAAADQTSVLGLIQLPPMCPEDLILLVGLLEYAAEKCPATDAECRALVDAFRQTIRNACEGYPAVQAVLDWRPS